MYVTCSFTKGNSHFQKLTIIVIIGYTFDKNKAY